MTLKYFLIFLFSFTASIFANAETATILTVQRTNYKPEKRLIYDLSYNTNCEINMESPFDVYYRNNSTGERIPEFSPDSQVYFGPRIDSTAISSQQVSLKFKALDEIQNALGLQAEIIIRLEKKDENCSVKSEITYSSIRYSIEHIEMKMKKMFGMPSGVEWVLIKGQDANGPVFDCIVGNCQ